MFLFLFSHCFKSFLAIPLRIENIELRLVLIISSGSSITVPKEAKESLSFVADETNKILPK